MATVTNVMVTADHAVPVEPLGGTATVLVNSGDLVYYNDNPAVSATRNIASISAGSYAILTAPSWLKSAGVSSVTITISDASDSSTKDESGFYAKSLDQAAATGTQTLVSGFIYLSKFFLPRTTSITGVGEYVTLAGSGLTAAQNLVGIYDASGNLWAVSGDQSGVWTATGLKVATLTAQPGFSLTLPGGAGVWYWVATVFNGTGSPSFAGSASPIPPTAGLSAAPYNATIPGAAHRFGYETLGAHPSLPASLAGKTISDSGLANSIIWAAVK